MLKITSVSNPKIAFVKSLKDKENRIKNNMLIVEGENLIKDLPNDCNVNSVFFLEGKRQQYDYILNKYPLDIIYEVDNKVLKCISDTVTPCGIVAVVTILPSQKFSGQTCLVLDNVSDPGNVGTIIRTAVACGVKDIVCINGVDYTSPKVVRSSMGGIFRVNIVKADYDNVFDIINGYKLVCLDMSGDNLFDTQFLLDKVALAVGNEAHGISETLLHKSDRVLSLPMVGDIESLNAAVSMSVALYTICFRKN